MSLKAICDFVIHVESFRNVDLYHQGLYQLRFQIYSETSSKGEKTFAQPYFLSEAYKNSNSVTSNSVKQQDNTSNAPTIDEENSAFVTRPFLIRFCEEDVEINDMCHFQAEIDCLPNYLLTSFYVEAELLLTNLNNTTTAKQPTEKLVISKEKENSKTNEPNIGPGFKSLASFKCKISNAANGVNEYVPITFEDQHFAIAATTIHSTLIDFRFRNFGMLSLSKDGLDVIKTKSDEANRNQSKTFAEYLAKNFKNYSYEKLQEIFVKKLKDQYELIYAFYNEMFARCVLESYKKKFKSLTQPPMKLIIPEFTKAGPGEDSAQIMAANLLCEINFVGGQVLQMWFKLMELLEVVPRFILAILQHDYDRKIRERWSEVFERVVIKTNDFAINPNLNVTDKSKQLAAKKRKNVNYEGIDAIHVEDLSMFPSADVLPVLFEQISVRDSKENVTEISDVENSLAVENSSYKGIHLIVFVHGFQGNSFDMRLLKNMLNIMHPEALLLCSVANEDNTEGDIGDMGQKLATEVSNFIKDTCPGTSLGRLSFVGHSLGGLIIRASLPLLEEYSEKMHTFFTLSSPHLGYMYNASQIIQAGMWFLKQWRKSKCLTQLSMSDASNPEECFLYKLSEAKGINWFKNVAFMSSSQDQYAPFESARIEMCKEALSDSTKGNIYRKMARNLLNSLNVPALYRIDVNFKINDTNLDTMIGRAAHILFLESKPLIRMLLYRYDHFFA